MGAGLLLLLSGSLAFADPRLPAVISDHMVLQRGVRVPIWGWADPGETVRVGIQDARAKTRAGVDGRWKVVLPPLVVGGPFTLVVRGKSTLVVEDVLVGEVWLCAGQSNMSFPLGSADTAAVDVPKAAHETLRFFTAPRRSALEPASDTRGAWQVSTPETAREFSAVGYYFGTELQKSLDVPVGLLNASWSGTAAEEWIDRASLEADPSFRPILDRWAAVPSDETAIYRRPAALHLELDDFQLIGDAETVPLADFDDGAARTRMGGEWTFDWKSAPNVRFALTRAGDKSGWAAMLAGKIEANDLPLLHMSFQPWGLPIDLTRFRGVRFRVRGDAAFKLRLNVPSITDFDDDATPPIAAATEWTTVTVLFRDLKQSGWGVKLPLTLDVVSALTIEALAAHPATKRPPAGLFDGMIAPLAPFGIRGVVWYQGEGNTPRAYQYRRLLPALIRQWRALWGQGDFPFGIVQLAAYGPIHDEPRGSRWAELREAQLMTLAVPNTGLAVAIDQGDPHDVHPKHKVEVGRRLALWALATSYGKDVVYSGPIYDSMRVEPGKIRVHFRHADGGLVAAEGKPLRGFAVAGSDQTFHWAQAQIEGGDVVVWSDDVRKPVAVRYAWADSPDATLFNAAGLPASPFRTDDWKGKTADVR